MTEARALQQLMDHKRVSPTVPAWIERDAKNNWSVKTGDIP